jgi:hypothetical protein
MVGPFRRLLFPFLALFAWALLAVPSSACPFCTQQGQTLTGEVGQATMVLLGKLTDADEKANNGEGATTLIIEQIVKDNDWRAKRMKLVLPRYVPQEGRYLVFCDVFKDKLDPYRGFPVADDSDVGKYLKGALELKDEKPGKRLRFFFDFLDNADVEVSNDAFKEFANADYKDYRDMAKSLPPEKIARWIKDPKMLPFRYGLYASLLGHCGKPEHADLLKGLLEDPDKRPTSGVDGILAGYTMLKPAEGLKYVRGILQDPKKEFMLRYAALRTVRFFHDFRPDLMKKDDQVAAVTLLLDQGDIADLAIEDLRKWECWDKADQVMGLQTKDVYNVPIVRRAVLRFALSCGKKCSAAEKYVAEQRQKDKQAVDDAEELLKLEVGK